MIIKEQKLVFVDVVDNNNKYYHIELHDDNKVVSKFGRIGKSEQVKDYGYLGESFYNKTINSKLKKGYTKARILNNHSTLPSLSSSDITNIALTQIKYTNNTLKSVITRLAKANIHKITSSTGISYNDNEGLFTTPVGIITLDAIDEARNILALFIDNNKLRPIDNTFKDAFNKYLRLIPQSIGMKLSIDTVFPDINAIKKQNDVLDALESSYKVVTSTSSNDVIDNIFNITFDICSDTTI
jgi:poly [ADP-ribose] polymerase